MAALDRPRRLLIAVSVACYAGVFALFVAFERPGLGIGHGYYVAVVLAGMAAGPVAGAAGGAVATALYAVGVVVNPHVSPAQLGGASAAIRFVAYVLVGFLIGYYASRSRSLLARAEELASELRALAQRDFVTGLPNQRAFEIALNRRIESGSEFVLVVCDVPAAADLDDLPTVADRLLGTLGPDAEVCRIGSGQFAVLAALGPADGAAAMLVARVERALATGGVAGTAGWATFPRDGGDALGLYTAASERLDARKIVRGERPVAAAGA